ncbi:MAG: glycine cleavage system aminomethyltransferase GcvT [Synergistetes bacterium]|nr:glycine cleavage system aminomethyltransferase GcvT [Synergistota bacterium]
MKKTPLYEKHLELKAKMIEFGGWEMPLQYSSILEEHLSVRNNVGMFDISHMGEIEIYGDKAKESILRLTPVHEKKLIPGKASYSFLLNEKGGIIDDLIIYTFSSERFILVVNAGNIEKDLNWIKEQVYPKTEVKNLSDDISALSIQGPASGEIFKILFRSDLSDLKYYSFEKDLRYNNVEFLFVSRTGYTGELGFEIYARPEEILKLWDILLRLNVKPCGLGARDGLRLEAGMPLYGHELNENITPLEANLERFVDIERSFIGREALIQKEREKHLIGFKMLDKGVPREGQKIFILKNKEEVGYVTSGGYSPCLNEYIGMGYVKLYDKETELGIDIRDKIKRAVITALPFYKRR